MESIIAELFYGNITPSERSYRKSGEYAHILRLVTRNEEELTETLTQAQKETFEKFRNETLELSSMTEEPYPIWITFTTSCNRKQSCAKRKGPTKSTRAPAYPRRCLTNPELPPVSAGR